MDEKFLFLVQFFGIRFFFLLLQPLRTLNTLLHGKNETLNTFHPLTECIAHKHTLLKNGFVFLS